MAVKQANKFVTSLVAGAAALGSIFGGASTATAQDNLQPVAGTAPSSIQNEAWIKASRWAKANPTSMAVYVFIGNHEALSPEEFQAGIEKAIEQNFGIEAEVWTEMNNAPVTGLQIFMDDIATEPASIEKMGEEINSVIAMYKSKSQVQSLSIDIEQ